MHLVIFDLGSLFWSIALGPAGSQGGVLELVLGRVVQLSEGATHVAIACDGGRSFRTAIDAGYKADRRERADHLWQLLDQTREALARRYAVLVPPPYDDGLYPEADDVIATVVRWYEARRGLGDSCRIVTGDSDLAALVSDPRCVVLQRGMKGGEWRTYTEAELVAGAWDKVPVHPSRLAEFKALAGDDSDTFHPFPGIGPAKAVSLLKRYATAMDATSAAMAEPPPEGIPPAVIAKLRIGGRAAAERGLALATMRYDVAIDCDSILRGPVPQNDEDDMNDRQTAEDTTHGDAYEEPRQVAPMVAHVSEPRAIAQRNEPQDRPAPMVTARPPVDNGSRVRTSADIDQIGMALCAAQGEFSAVAKTRKADAGTRGSYMYANLADIDAAVKPALVKAGILVMQIPSGNVLVTRLLHGASAQWIEGSIQIVQPQEGRGGIQALGSALTYLRRYSLTSMLGIAPEDDDDGAAAQASGVRR